MFSIFTNICWHSSCVLFVCDICIRMLECANWISYGNKLKDCQRWITYMNIMHHKQFIMHPCHRWDSNMWPTAVKLPFLNVSFGIKRNWYNYMIFLCEGIFWEPCIQSWWSEDISNISYKRNRPIWALEDWQIQELSTKHTCWSDSPYPGFSSTMDQSLQGSERYSYAFSQVSTSILGLM